MTTMKILLFLFPLLILFFPAPAFAVVKISGDIEIITDEPLYSSSMWYPGLMQQKSFQVKNRGSSTKTVQIEALNESQVSNVANALTIEIREGGKTVYGNSPNKTMQNFFDDGAISLSDVPVNDTGKVYDLIVAMPPSVGDEYQGGRATFDLRVGFSGEPESNVIIASTSIESSPISTPPVTLGGHTGARQEVVLGAEVTPPTTPAEGEIISTPTSTQGLVSGIGKIHGDNLRWFALGSLLIIGLLLFLWFLWNKRNKSENQQ